MALEPKRFTIQLFDGLGTQAQRVRLRGWSGKRANWTQALQPLRLMLCFITLTELDSLLQPATACYSLLQRTTSHPNRNVARRVGRVVGCVGGWVSEAVSQRVSE